MYLATSADSTTFLVDTVPNDNKQFATYQFRNSIVLIWVKTVKKTDVNNATFTGTLNHFAIDTTNAQMAVVSIVTYRDGSILNSGNSNIQWTDIVPGSIAEAFVSYCKSWHDLQLKLKFMKNGVLFEIDHPWMYKFL